MPAIGGFIPFVGEHCETTTTGSLLQHAGITLTEPMLFGLGHGLAFGVFTFASMPGPFIGGRPKGEMITRHLARHLGIDIEYRQTRSSERAWRNIAEFIDTGRPVGVKLNSRFLDYFTSGVDFAGHYVAVHGYDDEQVFVVDTKQQGGTLSADRASFEAGRLWRGPMASNALTWTVNVANRDVEWARVFTAAITATAIDYLNPPISNFGAGGIRKTATLVHTWPDRYDPMDIATTGQLIEHGGTGGGLFRYFYRDFLTEANHHLESAAVDTAASLFDQAAHGWSLVASALIGHQADRLDTAAVSELLRELANLEERAMTLLASLDHQSL